MSNTTRLLCYMVCMYFSLLYLENQNIYRKMKIGIPKEVKKDECRVSLTPEGAKMLTSEGHQVLVESMAGVLSGFDDQQYLNNKASILTDCTTIWEKSDIIVKVKEPIEQEYNYMRKGQVVFTFFHFAASRGLTLATMQSKCVAIAYETVEASDGSLPLLVPMSEVAGRMASQEAAKYLEKTQGGKGMLMGGIPGVPAAKVIILGAGVVGVNAAKIASGMGAIVTLMDINLSRLRSLDLMMPKNIFTQYSSRENIIKLLPTADIVIGSVLTTGAKAPKLITRDMLSLIQHGSVLVDVAIDQGGCFETSHPTTHQAPIYFVDHILHYCVTNMPGAVPYTSTIGLTNATLPYIIKLADLGWKGATQEDIGLKKGLNIVNGGVVYKDIGLTFDLPWKEV